MAGQQSATGIAKADQAFASIPNFRPTLTESTGWIKTTIAIDPASNQFAIAAPSSPPRVFRFADLVAVEIVRDGRSVSKSNRGSQVAGAAVGAVLLGPAGLLLGGLSGSKRNEETIKRLVLKIYTNDLMNPVVEFPFLNSWGGVNANSFLVKDAARRADAWYGRFQAILHGQAQARSLGPQHGAIGNETGVGGDLGDETPTRQSSEDRTQAILARIEHRHGRRTNQARLEPEPVSDSSSISAVLGNETSIPNNAEPLKSKGGGAGPSGCAVLALLLAIGSCAMIQFSKPDDGPTTTTATNASAPLSASSENTLAPARDHPAPIEPIAVAPYTRADYPDTVRKFGRLIPTINAERNKVAKIVANEAGCDAVENVQITNGAAKVARRYMAECANLTRYFFDKNSLAKGVPARIQTKDDMLRNGLVDW